MFVPIMFEPIRNLSVGDKFTATGLFAVSTRIFTVERFSNWGSVIALDESGRVEVFDLNRMIWVVTKKKSS